MKINVPDTKTPSGFTTIQISKSDLDKFNRYNWRIITHYFGTENERKDVSAWTGGKRIWLARYLLDATGKLEADHINHDPLDNRRVNIRLVTRRQNSFNKRTKPVSGYHGVYTKKGGHILVCVTIGPLTYEVSGFTNSLDAAKAYNELASMLHKNTAVLNNI